jgi:hypothetical protein
MADVLKFEREIPGYYTARDEFGNSYEITRINYGYGNEWTTIIKPATGGEEALDPFPTLKRARAAANKVYSSERARRGAPEPPQEPERDKPDYGLIDKSIFEPPPPREGDGDGGEGGGDKPNLVFWWEREGVLFVGPMVNHPGNAAQPFMEAGFAAMDAAAEGILKKHYGF